jgi:hypothetical protein
MKKYTMLKIATILQFAVAIIHAITLFITPPANNEIEKQLYSLMNTYKFDFGFGFHRTMNQLTVSFSACLCLLCLLGGLLNGYLLRKKVEASIIQGVININLLVFGILLVLTIVFAFWLPIILAGLIFLFLLFSRFARK